MAKLGSSHLPPLLSPSGRVGVLIRRAVWFVLFLPISSSYGQNAPAVPDRSYTHGLATVASFPFPKN